MAHGYRIVEHKVDCVVDSRDRIGEGAFWCHDEEALYWLDVPMPSCLHRFVPKTGRHDSWPMPEMITALAKRSDGTLLVASESGLGFFDPRHPVLKNVAALEPEKPSNRSNDGAPDARGRFLIGTMQNNLGPNGEAIPISSASGGLWSIAPDLERREVANGLNITNGVVWSPDSRVLYVADSMIQRIFAFDYDLDTGSLANRRVFSAIEDLGYPDGAAVDSAGYVWSARWDGHCVARFAPDGALDYVVPIPASNVTSCAFGGHDLATLYVTTARLDVAPEVLRRYQQQGGVFAFRPGVAGTPRPRFAG